MLFTYPAWVCTRSDHTRHTYRVCRDATDFLRDVDASNQYGRVPRVCTTPIIVQCVCSLHVPSGVSPVPPPAPRRPLLPPGACAVPLRRSPQPPEGPGG